MAYPLSYPRPAVLSAVLAVFAAVLAAASGWAAPPAPQMQPVGTPHLDRSGRARVGKASFYAHRFAGRKMADGTPMRLQGNNAASKTLPLGTTAMVTNIQTGRTAIVTIRDRGPYVKGRIVDLSPSTAHKIGLEPKQGVTKVEVAPLEVPLPGGGMKAGGPYPDPKKVLSARAARAAESPPQAGG
ncbi:MAG: septal ring lytic transglycosylase RlpA family protein [Steroidobacteraceae bacterium]